MHRRLNICNVMFLTDLSSEIFHQRCPFTLYFDLLFNPLKVELIPICHLLALLGDHHILHISRMGFNNNKSEGYPVQAKQKQRILIYIKPTRCTNFSHLIFFNKTLYVSDISSVHHQESFCRSCGRPSL